MSADIYSTVFQIYDGAGTGSGFYLASHDVFLTNYHVVSGFKSVAVCDNDKNAYLGRVILVNQELDLAALVVDHDFSHLPSVELADKDSVELGMKARVGGYPFGMPFTLTEGTVSSPKQLLDDRYLIQIDAAVNPGNSGGPIFNEEGQVVGITASKFENADSTAFGIRLEDIHTLMEALDGIDRSCFHAQCNSCDELIEGEERYCPMCGVKLDKDVFAERQISEIARFCEEPIERLGVNPVAARRGNQHWEFFMGRSRIDMFDYRDTYLFTVSLINLLPKKKVEPVLEYLLKTKIAPFKLGLDGREIYFMYRLHLSDIHDDNSAEIQDTIVRAAKKAEELAQLLHEEFGCEYSPNSRKE
ncbi:MAG: protease [Bacteroidetes bacterium]|nr:MAG: protease [Bacteroidota bacterium]